MWIVFRDPQTVFYQVDKYVVDLVEDDDISAYQDMLSNTSGGMRIEFHTDVHYIQPFFRTPDGVDYSVKKYKSRVMTPETDRPHQGGYWESQTQLASKSHDAVLLNPCNNGR